MASTEDLDRRLTVVEERLDMEAGLAAGRDRDLSNMQVTLRSHTAMLQALQERQAEHDRRFDEVDRRFDELSAGQQTIVTMLTTLIERDTDS